VPVQNLTGDRWKASPVEENIYPNQGPKWLSTQYPWSTFLIGRYKAHFLSFWSILKNNDLQTKIQPPTYFEHETGQSVPSKRRKLRLHIHNIKAQEKQDRNCQTIIINIWSWAPDGARHQDSLIDWPSVAMWPWLWLNFILCSLIF
jgi:hypothetical protein